MSVALEATLTLAGRCPLGAFCLADTVVQVWQFLRGAMRRWLPLIG